MRRVLLQISFMPVFLMILMTPAPLWADQSGTVDVFFSALKLFAGTAIVVGIMLLLYYLNRRGAMFLEARNAGKIKIVETRGVGGKKALCLVEIRGEMILLGLGNERIDLLHHFDTPPGENAGEPRNDFENELRGQYEGLK